MAQISSLSNEYVEVPVAFVVGGVSTDPRGDAVSLAFTAPGVDPVTWIVGSWEPNGPPYVARTLVGSAGTVLAKGNYDVWVKITDSPEIPAKKAGFLKVF